jgi:hypothetical protein
MQVRVARPGATLRPHMFVSFSLLVFGRFELLSG